MNDISEVRLARTADELKAAYRLLHDEYVRAGYQDPDRTGMRLIPQYGLPESHTLVVVEREEVVGTATLIVRGRLGMPLEAVYFEDLGGLRAGGRRPAEISGLAIRSSHRGAALKLFGALYSYAFHALGVTDFLITVNPAHVGFYETILLFEKFGDVRHLGKLKGAPALLMRLDLTTAAERFCARGQPLAPGPCTDYRRLGDEIRRDLLEAVAARLELARELRRYRKATRRFLKLRGCG